MNALNAQYINRKGSFPKWEERCYFNYDCTEEAESYRYENISKFFELGCFINFLFKRSKLENTLVK